MQIEDFLKTYVEGYLFHDLNSMAAIELPAGQPAGAAGYPLLMATISGMNLLGTLLFPTPLRDELDPGRTYFMHYWQEYLEKTERSYSHPKTNSVIWSVARNGMAHSFIPKPGLMVTKGRSENHLRVDHSSRTFWIDATQFALDLQESYVKRVRPIIDGTSDAPCSRDHAQKQLTAFLKIDRRASDEILKPLFLRKGYVVESVFKSAATSATSGTMGSTLDFEPLDSSDPDSSWISATSRLPHIWLPAKSTDPE